MSSTSIGWVTRAALAAVVAASTVIAGGSAAQAAVPDGVVIAVTGSNKALYVQTAGQANWKNLGGQLATAPAVVSWNGVTHYVASGTNQVLYHRTGTTGWHRLAPGYCTHVTAIAAAGQVQVACRGGNAVLYTGTFDATLQSPTIAKLKAGPGRPILGAAAIINTYPDVPSYYARGATYLTGHGPDGDTYANTYNYTHRYGWQEHRRDEPCQSDMAKAHEPGVIYEVCQVDDGVIVVDVEYSDESGWVRDWYPLAGQISGTPSVVITDYGAELFVRGSNGAVYHRPIDVWGPLDDRWTKINAVVIGGVAAAMVQ